MPEAVSCFPSMKRGTNGATPSEDGSSPASRCSIVVLLAMVPPAMRDGPRPARSHARTKSGAIVRRRRRIAWPSALGERAASIRVSTLSPNRICSLNPRRATTPRPLRDRQATLRPSLSPDRRRMLYRVRPVPARTTAGAARNIDAKCVAHLRPMLDLGTRWYPNSHPLRDSCLTSPHCRRCRYDTLTNGQLPFAQMHFTARHRRADATGVTEIYAANGRKGWKKILQLHQDRRSAAHDGSAFPPAFTSSEPDNTLARPFLAS